MSVSHLCFLKLGGSLITDKNQPRTPRREVLAQLAEEIAAARAEDPQQALVLGHGSGSFGHVPARKYGTRQGVQNQAQWLGFAEVWKEARSLNQIVVEALFNAGVPVIAFPPSAAVTARNGEVLRWDLSPVQAALDSGLVPLVNGDTIFDEARGGTILSTEDLFIYMARRLRPQRILLAGIEDGVWNGFPARTALIPQITPANIESVAEEIGGSASVDVTGGMLEKVRTMLALAAEMPGFYAQIFSGLQPGLLKQVLLGAPAGTRISQPDETQQG